MVQAAKKKIDSGNAFVDEQREHARGDEYLKGAQAKLAAVDVAVEKLSQAELPFLKGIEVLN